MAKEDLALTWGGGMETRNASKQAQKPEKRSKRAIKQYGNKTCTADDICRA